MAIPKISVKWIKRHTELHQLSRNEFFVNIGKQTKTFKKKFPGYSPTTVIIHPDEMKAMGKQAVMIVNLVQLELSSDPDAPKEGFVVAFIKTDQQLTRDPSS